MNNEDMRKLIGTHEIDIDLVRDIFDDAPDGANYVYLTITEEDGEFYIGWNFFDGSNTEKGYGGTLSVEEFDNIDELLEIIEEVGQ